MTAKDLLFADLHTCTLAHEEGVKDVEHASVCVWTTGCRNAEARRMH